MRLEDGGNRLEERGRNIRNFEPDKPVIIQRFHVN
jgi:hypothetical protein